MPASVLIITYNLDAMQEEIPLGSWQVRAEKIAKIEGLRWKYWITKPGTDERGGVYLFESLTKAKAAAEARKDSLIKTAVGNITISLYEVDGNLSKLTRGDT